ncbi:hypothetical protein GCM10010909_34350 [Acidocella aquatica]|uniref:Uncharacterized protein n=1 Tax=Acidocella aquatica TaxID=1922313 RepID=A0ABQ6AB06_9PROT|nr:hypothetical protein [Acidocella aquatica]GLR68753.1 hypothetical protein GCM10010909_34350 [Acidocella aquatica]
MSETETETETKGETAKPVAPPRPRRSLWPVFLLLSFVILAGGEGYLWKLQQSLAGQGTAVAVLQAQVADLRAQAAQARPGADSIATQADISLKFATLSAQVNAMQSQLAADHGTLTTLQVNATDLTKLTARIALLNQLESARMALDNGMPLGTIANAPPALAQFAATPPPTEAALRLGFPAAAAAAEAASIAGNAQGGFWARVLLRLDNFITIRQGAHVLVGSPASGALAQAATLLGAGDLAGAVAQVGTLSESTQQAMGGWLTQAKALLAARAALIAMAGQA